MCKEFFKKSDTLNFYLCIHTYEQPFTCCICKKSFRQSCNLKLHLHTNSGEHLFTCDVFKKSVKQSGSLKLHLRAPNVECPFMCAVVRNPSSSPVSWRCIYILTLEGDPLLVVFVGNLSSNWYLGGAPTHLYTIVAVYLIIYKDEYLFLCLFVCMYGTYTNPQFW